MKLVLASIIFTNLLTGSVSAEICRKKLSLNTKMQCNTCNGDLHMLLRPYGRVYYYQNDLQTTEIKCTVNKPANISISFRHIWKPVSEGLRELSTATNISGITLRKSNGGCTYSIQFHNTSSLMSICYLGEYTCRAVANANETITKNQKLEGFYTSADQPFTFKVEDTDLQESNELILGSSANLVCSFVALERPGKEPYFKFYKLFGNGTTMEVKNTQPATTQTKYTLSSRVHKFHFKQTFTKYTRILSLSGINADANITFLCRVAPLHGDYCHIEKRIHIKTRLCKNGYYCNPNSSKELPCKEGQFSNVAGLFNESGCKICPLNTYCPPGSPWPVPCPNSHFFTTRQTEMKIFEGKRKPADCKSCPVDPCDKNAEQCTFICGNRRFTGNLGKSVSIHCILSNGTLMQNLSWYKDNKTIIDGDAYKIDRGQKDFVLTIRKLSTKDAGNYVCSGSDTIMGNHFDSAVSLDVVDSGGSSNVLLAILLSISFALLFVSTTGFLVHRCWRKSTAWFSTMDEGVRFVNDMVTLPISNTCQSDLPTLIEGNTEEKYDVFICYSSADKTWVRRTLLPTLKDFNLRVCIDFEDFNPGGFIIQNIADAIFSSRKTLAVLSPDFLCSAWCQKELMMALTRVRDRHKVIPVMYRSCEVPLFLSDITYLDWCNEDVRLTFWDQLIRTIDDQVELEIDNGACNPNETRVH